MELREKTRKHNGQPMKDRRSPCPIACTLDLLGDRWTLLVVRDLFLGRSQFKEFAASPEKIATNILSDRLSRLVEAGIAEHRLDGSSKRGSYRLTKKGESLRPLVEQIASWGLKHIDGTEMRLKAKS